MSTEKPHDLPEPESDDAEDEADALETAKSLHDQAQYLLDDEIGYAATLRDARKTAATLIVVAVSIGAFRIDLFRADGQDLIVPSWAALTIRGLFMAAFVCLLFGAFWTYTERSLWREFVKTSERTGGALSILNLKVEVFDEFVLKTPREVMRMRTEGLRVAYKRLKESNRMVRARLTIGTILLFVGLTLVVVAFGIYTFTVNSGPLKGASHDKAQEGPKAAFKAAE